MSLARIGDVVGTTKSVVWRSIDRNRLHGSAEYRNRGRSGRGRITTNLEDRYIVRSVHRRRTLNATQVNTALRAATGTAVSTNTIRRRLHEQGWHARRRAVCPLLLPVHRAARRTWAEAHADWGVAEWDRCMFTDECKFNLYESDGRILVWRGRNERFREENMNARVAFGGGGVTVWGGIMRNGRTDLVVLMNETMNGVRYRDLVINEIVIPFAHNFGDDFILVDDNARPHRAGVVQEVLRENNIERLEWPARSPDMNVIEHVWSKIKLRLNASEVVFENLNELADAIRVEWEAIPQHFIADLVRSMPRRVIDVLRARSGPTKY